jgi:hypothetical protein
MIFTSRENPEFGGGTDAIHVRVQDNSANRTFSGLVERAPADKPFPECQWPVCSSPEAAGDSPRCVLVQDMLDTRTTRPRGRVYDMKSCGFGSGSMSAAHGTPKQ